MMDLIVGNSAVSSIVEAVRNIPILKEQDVHFLQEHKEHLAAVLERTHMWRTDTQKRSIVSDFYHPTLHSKFHQAILEQKVQFDQAMYLAKDFEMKKLEIEELECDLEELGNSKRDDIKRRKIQIEIQFKQYELKNMQIAMDYRMQEVKGWQKIIDQLLDEMRKAGLSEEEIWSKDKGEVTSLFFQTLNNLTGLSNSKDAGEINNLVALAKFAVQQAKEYGIYDHLRSLCNEAQLQYLNFIEGINRK